MTEQDESSLLSEEMTEALLKGYAEANPGKPLDSEHFSLILKWAEEAEVGRHLLKGILMGDILPSVKRSKVVFSVSKKGLAKANDIIQDDIILGNIIKLPNSENIQ